VQVTRVTAAPCFPFPASEATGASACTSAHAFR
jgi:hypothetical protein